MTPDRHAYLATIEREAKALSHAARGGVTAAVPACPGWTVASVLGHLGRVHRLVALTIERRSTDVVPFSETARPPDSDGVLDYFDEGAAALLNTLRATPDDAPAWNWGGSGTAAFYFRRMAHETALHRRDVEDAYGAPQAFEPEMAADGVAELYEVVLPSGVARFGDTLPSGSLHLHRTDGDGEWMVQAVDGRIAVSHEHGKGDAAVRGSASDLLAFGWNRGLAPTVQVFGDASVARAWAALAK